MVTTQNITYDPGQFSGQIVYKAVSVVYQEGPDDRQVVGWVAPPDGLRQQTEDDLGGPQGEIEPGFMTEGRPLTGPFPAWKPPFLMP